MGVGYSAQESKHEITKIFHCIKTVQYVVILI